MNLVELGKQLRAHADVNIRLGDPVPADGNKLRFVRVEFGETGFDVALERIGVDPAHDLSVYIAFISGAPRCASDAQCEAICRAIYDVEWQEPQVPAVTPPGCRWFIRVRREPYIIKQTE